jgi:DNA-binding CsgD family transcriptional regulator
VRPEGPPPFASLLTPREREITVLLAQRLNGEEIATRLFLSHHTVRTHVRNAMHRAQAKTRPHLIALALEAGEITFPPESTTAR